MNENHNVEDAMLRVSVEIGKHKTIERKHQLKINE